MKNAEMPTAAAVTAVKMSQLRKSGINGISKFVGNIIQVL